MKKILVALKAFSTPYFGPLISEYLDGCCSSGLFETKLAKKYFKGEISTFSPAYKKDDIREIVNLSDHIVFNSSNQLNEFYNIAIKFKNEIGLRINPLYSEINNDVGPSMGGTYSATIVCQTVGHYPRLSLYFEVSKLK